MREYAKLAHDRSVKARALVAALKELLFEVENFDAVSPPTALFEEVERLGKEHREAVAAADAARST